MTISPPSVDTALIRRALHEDRATADITTRALIPPPLRVRAHVIANASGVVAGTTIAQRVFHAIDRRIRCTVRHRDGQRVRRGEVILTLSGHARTILAAERTALNVLSHLSGIATLTRAFVDRVKPSRVAILDTRKTLPGLRALEKYAVRVGGGQSHRASLSTAVLIKTNHLRALAGRQKVKDKRKKLIHDAIHVAKKNNPKQFIEIEVTNLRELKAALEARPTAILLDNWSISGIRNAMKFLYARRYPLSARPLLEVSGGVTLANVRAIAKTGVDRISIGRLTHSAPALDLSLRVV